jgi:hypothetical protein
MRRRRKASQQPEVDEATAAESAQPAVPGVRSDGPFDSTEHPVDPADEERADLGSLVIQAHPEMEVRLQVDEATGEVQAVMMVSADGAMELRAFAAPRHEDIWDDIRPRIAEEAQRMGGRAEEVDGPYGRALRMIVPAVTPDGQQVEQPSLVVGIPGPRWLLRVSMFGAPADAYDEAGVLEGCLRRVVVHRGNEPMPPGEPLPLMLPDSAHRMDL